MSYPSLSPTLITAALMLQPAILAPREGLFTSPAMQLLLTGLITAGILYLTQWLTQRNLKMSIENIRFQAEAAAAELKSQAEKVDKIAQNTTAVQVTQAEIGAKVDGQMSALQASIAALSSDLVAAKLAVVTEQDKAEQLAKQAITDKAEADARLVAAQLTQGAAPTSRGDGAGSVTIPEVVVPVDAAKPPEEPKRIVTP